MGTGKTYSTKYLLDSNNSSGVAGQVLSTTSTGIDWADANTLPGSGLWLENGNDIYNSNSGNVGINVTNPGTKLVVSGADDTGGTGVVELKTSGGTNLKLGGNTTYSWIQSHASKPLYINQLGNNIILNLGGGSVGIGTDSPANKLDVEGRIQGDNFVLGGSDSTVFYGMYRAGTETREVRLVSYEATPNSKVQLGFNNLSGSTYTFAPALTAKANLNVGIGTDDPGSKLEVNQNSTGTTYLKVFNQNAGVSATARMAVVAESAQLDIIATSAGYTGVSGWADSGVISTDSGASGGLILNAQTGGLKLQTGLSTKMVVLASGNVGIGTTNPSTKLHVIGQDATFYSNTGDQSLQVGRNANERLELYVNDNMGKITAIQDSDNDGPHNFILNRIFAGTGSNDFLIQKDGSTQLIVDTNGNVGIGTTSPGAKLHISGNSALNDTSTQSLLRLERPFNSGVSFAQGGDIAIGRGTTYPSTQMRFILDNGTNDPANPQATIMALDSSGNVGIGTTSPGANLTVQSVTGTLRLGNNIGSVATGAVVGKIEFSNVDTSIGAGVQAYIQSRAIDNGATYAMDFFTGTKDNPTQTSLSLYNGNVGIGTTSPGFKFVVQDDGTDQMIADFRDSNSVYGLLLSSTGTGGKIEGRGTNHDLTINTSGTGDITLIPGGNVGIGTTSPSEKLEVDGNVQIGSTTDAKLYMVSTGGNGNNERFFIEGYADGGTYGGGFKLSTRDDVNVFNTAVTVNRNGNVGIGETNPGQKLDVNGNIKVHGDLMLQSGSSIVLTDQPTANTGGGTIVNWSVSDATTAGTLYTVKTNGLWTPVDADNEATSIGMLAIALSSNANLGMLLQGFFYKASHGFTIGLPLYISNTAGAFTTTRPTGTNDYVRIIGYATSANYIYFDPDKTWVQVA